MSRSLPSGASRRRVVVRLYQLRQGEARRAAPPEPGDEVQGGWTREQLLRMDDCFIVAVEAAFRSGSNPPRQQAPARRRDHEQALDGKLMLRSVRPASQSPPQLALALPNFARVI